MYFRVTTYNQAEKFGEMKIGALSEQARAKRCLVFFFLLLSTVPVLPAFC